MQLDWTRFSIQETTNRNSSRKGKTHIPLTRHKEAKTWRSASWKGRSGNFCYSHQWKILQYTIWAWFAYVSKSWETKRKWVNNKADTVRLTEGIISRVCLRIHIWFSWRQLEVSSHSSTSSLQSPIWKLTLTSTESLPLKGNMLSSAKSLGK